MALFSTTSTLSKYALSSEYEKIKDKVEDLNSTIKQKIDDDNIRFGKHDHFLKDIEKMMQLQREQNEFFISELHSLTEKNTKIETQLKKCRNTNFLLAISVCASIAAMFVLFILKYV